MPLVRTPFWDTRELHDFLIREANKPFEWGVADCCLLAANAIKSFTGVDLADDFRGKYTTKIGAFRAIKSVCNGSTIEDAAVYCAQKHGLTEYQHPLCARRGDLVVFNNGGDVIAGVVGLSGRHLISVSETGLVRLPITDVRRAWSV
jgi:hypothetical protein